MAIVTGLTKERMLEIEAASIVDGTVDVDGHLILTRHDGTTIDAGYIVDGTNIVNTVGNQNINGIKTFLDGIVIPVDGLPQEAIVNLVDELAGVVHLTGDETITDTKTFEIIKYQNPCLGRWYLTTAQTIAPNLDTPINWATKGTVDFNRSIVNTGTHLTPQVAGYYRVTANVKWANAATTGERELYIAQNGDLIGVNARKAFSGGTNEPLGIEHLNVTGVMHFNGTTNYVEIWVYQDIGSNLDIVTLWGSTSVALEYIGN